MMLTDYGGEKIRGIQSRKKAGVWIKCHKDLKPYLETAIAEARAAGIANDCAACAANRWVSAISRRAGMRWRAGRGHCISIARICAGQLWCASPRQIVRCRRLRQSP